MGREQLPVETHYKIGMATAALMRLAAEKQRYAAWGQVYVRFLWENGCLKVVEINDATDVGDRFSEQAPP